MSKNKNAATAAAPTISEIEGRYQASRSQPDRNSPITMLDDLGSLLGIVKNLDDENNQLAQRVLIAEGTVAKVRQMQTAKSSKKQAKIFRKIVRDDAKDYAKEHVDEDAKKFYVQMNDRMAKTRRRSVIVIVCLLVVVLAEGSVLAAKWLNWF